MKLTWSDTGPRRWRFHPNPPQRSKLWFCAPEPVSSHSLHGPGRVGGSGLYSKLKKPKARPNWYKGVSDSYRGTRREMMRGVGGPLLCIGDLLSDVGESDASPPPQQPETSSSSFVSSSDQSLDLTKLFQVFLFFTISFAFLIRFLWIARKMRWVFHIFVWKIENPLGGFFSCRILFDRKIKDGQN